MANQWGNYVCTVWVKGFGRCSRPATWNGRVFRCDEHGKRTRRKRPKLTPKKHHHPEQGETDAAREPADRQAA